MKPKHYWNLLSDDGVISRLLLSAIRQGGLLAAVLA